MSEVWLPANHPRWRKLNRPPNSDTDDKNGWAWITREMLESDAFWALTPNAMRVVMRVVLEHIAHGGQENGRLPCTYDNFEAYGIRRMSIHPAVAVAVALGFLDVTEKGRGGKGIGRAPAKFRLTWLPTRDGSTPTNRWKAIKSREQAAAAVKKAEAIARKRPGPAQRPSRRTAAQATNQNIDSSSETATETGVSTPGLRRRISSDAATG
jgi:hypothetical protein